MGRVRGFPLKRRGAKLFRRKPSLGCYRRMEPIRLAPVKKPLSRFSNWIRTVKAKVKGILPRNTETGCILVGHDPSPIQIPRGYVGIYVGEKYGEFQQILVPLPYLNHPLFEDLLKEAEKEYGFDHSGRISIPCRLSEFEQVQRRITAD